MDVANVTPLPTAKREVRLTSAADIKIRPVHWLWSDRLALGTLGLIAGREGIGKSTVGYTLAADVTRGRMPGTYHGKPKAVIVAATEDSWEHTIVPRLMAADADLSRIFRVDVTTGTGFDSEVCLPNDLVALEGLIRQVDAALVLLDPLLSRLSPTLDTHKDAEVRQALEPLSAVANSTRAAFLGLIHLNKSGSNDPLSLLMGSRAFAAVARSVLFVMRDPDDDDKRLLGEPKNNLGRTDLPSLSFRIVGAKVADTDEGPVSTGKVTWLGEDSRNINDALAETAHDGETRTAITDAAGWLTDYLYQQGGTALSADVQAAGRKAGHSESALKRARARLKIISTSEGFPRRTFWSIPGTQPSQVTPGESELTELTGLTEPTGQSGQSGQSVQWDQAPRASEPTAQQDDLWATR